MYPRVLMFGWEFPPHNSGGLGTACEGLTRALADQGVKTIFVLPKKVGVEADFLKILFANIPNATLKTIPSILYPYVTSQSYLESLATNSQGDKIYGATLLDEVLSYGLKAKDIARQECFDIIHAHDWLSFPAGIMAKEISSRPLIVHVHATEFDRTGGNGINEAVYRIEKEGMEKADGIITVSHWTKNIVTKHYGISPAKIRVVHNGINLGAEKTGSLMNNLEKLKSAGNNLILFVGRITLQKGPDYFVQVAKQVLEYKPNTYFVMVGSGDMQGSVMQLVAQLGISDKFLFPGFLRGEELDSVYQVADLYILPSVSEPFGITPLESLANGTPVLVSKQSGVSEVLSHALKVDFWDIDEMTNQILAVLDHQSLKETLRQYGQEQVKQITWTEAARKCLEFYQSLIKV